MVDTKIYKIIITLLAAIILIGGVFLYQGYQDVERLNERDKSELSQMVWQVGSKARSMDYNIAKAMATNDRKAQATALLEAQSNAAILNNSDSNLIQIDNIMGTTRLLSSGFNSFWNQSQSYLSYLLNIDRNLNEVDRENLQLMRDHLKIIWPAFNDLNRVIKEEEYAKLSESKVLRSTIKDMIAEIEKLPNIGEDDISFKNYRYGWATGERDFGFESEEQFSEEELSEKVRTFMKDIWDEEAKVVSGGGGHDPQFGEYLTFNAIDDNNRMIGSYGVNITIRGGHILRVQSDEQYNQVQDKTLGKLTSEEAIEFAQEFINKWGEESLKLYSTEESDNGINMTFVPVREEIELVNRKVQISVDISEGKLLTFDAYDYFFLKAYNQEPPLKSVLTEEEALGKLSDDIEATDVPKLEIRGGESGRDILVYTIPVKGLDKVSYIYINAVSGEFEGMEYEFQN